MVLDADLPQQAACFRIDGVGVPASVTEVSAVARRAARADAADVDGGAYDRPCIERPVNTTGTRVERVHVARNASDEYAAARDGDRGPRLHVAREAEGPLQREPRHIGSR